MPPGMPTPLPSAWKRTVVLLSACPFDVHLAGMVMVHPKAGYSSVTVLLPDEWHV